MGTIKKMTKAEAKARSKHAEFLCTAAYTVRGYGLLDLHDQLIGLADLVKNGSFDFDPARILDD
jgi:hypothetical protein